MKSHTTPLLLSIMVSFLASTPAFAQLGFCNGSKGDPIFQEDFGSGSGTGNPLASGVTSYTFVTGDPQDGQYTISDQISQQIHSWHDRLPPTTKSNGKALIVNADYTAGLFYQKTISGLCQHASYEFSAYLMNIFDASSSVCGPNGGIPINVRFEIWNASNTKLLKEGSTGDIAGTTRAFWKRYGMTFQSQPGQAEIILKMFNNSGGGCGNDLAIDDIIFRSCGDLTTISPKNSTEKETRRCEENLPQAITFEAHPDNSIYTDHYYQWQQSEHGTQWMNIPGATHKTYTTTISGTHYFRVQIAEDPANLSDNFCSTFSQPYLVEVIPTPPAPISNGDIVGCPQTNPNGLSVNVPSGYEVNWYKTATSTTPVAANTKTFIPETNGDYYAAAIALNAPCSAGPRTKLRYQLYEVPELGPDEVLQICQGAQIELSTAPQNGMTYNWSTGESSPSIHVSKEGEYTLTTTNKSGCSATKKFKIEYSIEPKITDISVANGKIKILTTPEEGNFLYSIDGNNYHGSNLFQVDQGGVYTAYVKAKNGCGIKKQIFPVLLYPQFMTPNKDGYNDVFKLKGADYFSAAELFIYDRFGKLLFQQKGKNLQWNGFYNGKAMPANEYWFLARIAGQKNVTGHFSLIR